MLSFWKPPRKDVLDQTIWQASLLDNESLLDQTTLSLRFHNHKVSGSSGCNRFRGKYEVSGKNIEFTELTLGTDRCMNPGIMEQETTFTAMLANSDHFELAERQLILFSPDGKAVTLIPLEPGQ